MKCFSVCVTSEFHWYRESLFIFIFTLFLWQSVDQMSQLYTTTDPMPLQTSDGFWSKLVLVGIQICRRPNKASAAWKLGSQEAKSLSISFLPSSQLTVWYVERFFFLVVMVEDTGVTAADSKVHRVHLTGSHWEQFYIVLRSETNRKSALRRHTK